MFLVICWLSALTVMFRFERGERRSLEAELHKRTMATLALIDELTNTVEAVRQINKAEKQLTGQSNYFR